jgi:hypothetical protein
VEGISVVNTDSKVKHHFGNHFMNGEEGVMDKKTVVDI